MHAYICFLPSCLIRKFLSACIWCTDRLVFVSSEKISSCIKILFYCCSVNPFSVYGVFHNCLWKWIKRPEVVCLLLILHKDFKLIVCCYIFLYASFIMLIHHYFFDWQRNPKYPDFKHKDTGEALWVEGRYNPSWVKSQLAILDERMGSLRDQDSKLRLSSMSGDDFLSLS